MTPRPNLRVKCDELTAQNIAQAEQIATRDARIAALEAAMRRMLHGSSCWNPDGPDAPCVIHNAYPPCPFSDARSLLSQKDQT